MRPKELGLGWQLPLSRGPRSWWIALLTLLTTCSAALWIEGAPPGRLVDYLYDLELKPGRAALPPAQPFSPNQWLTEDDTISVGNLTLEILHCPGHTPGHVALVERSSNKVIVGDIIFAGSIGRTDFPQGNHQQLIEAIREKLFTLPDEMTVYPGHGPTTSIGHERSTNPFVADAKFG